VRRAALLGTDLHDALGARCDLLHPFALADKEVQRLFHVDVLPRVAREHHLQGVPVIGRRCDHRVNVLALEQLSKVGMLRAVGTGQLRTGIHTRPVAVGDADDF
jgi:hypothetical protein